MNRKLHHTILAFSVAGLAALAGLLATHPVAPRATAGAPAAWATASELSPDDVAAIDAHAERLERALTEATSPADTASAIGGFVAAVATLSALAALERRAEGGEGAPAAAADPGEADAEPARRARARRQAIAMPYFSFSHGSRQGRS
ncbi:hypothetical protein LDO32_09650 [Luteimonas sp. Y-2-2-4F]|nr:hypothetical protein [Luteimonas sp. Y-2-2-4F]MCD9031984.1 hypothetical protein [Luteimonas sp. Y-2-2-4F]